MHCALYANFVLIFDDLKAILHCTVRRWGFIKHGRPLHFHAKPYKPEKLSIEATYIEGNRKHIIYFCTWDDFFRILKKTSFQHSCTQLYIRFTNMDYFKAL